MPRRSALVLLAALSGVALTACGGDEEPGASVPESRSSRSASPVATPTPLAETPAALPPPSPSPSPTRLADVRVPAPTATRPVQTRAPASASAQESSAPVGQPPCRAADVTVVDADTVVLPSSVHEVFVLRTSGPDCQLEGHPEVRLLDASGAPLPVTVRRGGHDLPATAPSPVTLSRGTSLSFVVATARDGTCADAAAVDVTLPGTTTVLRTATALSVCGSAGVSPVERRTADE